MQRGLVGSSFIIAIAKYAKKLSLGFTVDWYCFANAVINLYKIPISSKTLIVDKDKSKINLSIGDSELKIKKVTKNNLKSKKLIIISSYYTNEIYKEIKELKLNIDVLKIFPSIVIKKNV